VPSKAALVAVRTEKFAKSGRSIKKPALISGSLGFTIFVFVGAIAFSLFRDE